MNVGPNVNVNMERSGSIGRAIGWDRVAHRRWSRRCVVSLSKTLYPLLSTDTTQEDRKSSRHD